MRQTDFATPPRAKTFIFIAVLSLSGGHAWAQPAPKACDRALDIAKATTVSANREEAGIRFSVKAPECSNLKIVGIWKALELSSGARTLTGKVAGLAGPYKPDESALISHNRKEENPFLEPGDVEALQGSVLIKGDVAIEYRWGSDVKTPGLRVSVPVSIQVPAFAPSQRKTR